VHVIGGRGVGCHGEPEAAPVRWVWRASGRELMWEARMLDIRHKPNAKNAKWRSLNAKS
jgi:hypothetical protein